MCEEQCVKCGHYGRMSCLVKCVASYAVKVPQTANALPV